MCPVDMAISEKRMSIVGSAERVGNVRSSACVELDTLRAGSPRERRPEMTVSRGLGVFLWIAAAMVAAFAQAPTGPMTPQPGTPVQQPPPQQNKIVTQVALVNTPVTVRDIRGQMVNSL